MHELENEWRALREVLKEVREQLCREREERAMLYEVVRELGEQLRILKHIEHEVEEIENSTRPKLAFLKIAIGGIMPVGPATLTVGQTAVATVQGFDQNGAPFAIDFTANPVTWVDDNEPVVQDAPAADRDGLTAVAPGVANLTATCAGFSDTEAVTVVAQAPRLASIKVSID